MIISLFERTSCTRKGCCNPLYNTRLDKHPPGTKAGRSPETKISRMCSDMSRGQSMLADSHGSNGPSTRQAKLNGRPSHSQGSQVRSTAWISNHTPWQPKEHFNTLCQPPNHLEGGLGPLTPGKGVANLQQVYPRRPPLNSSTG